MNKLDRTNFIISSGGFIIPANNYFKPFDPKGPDIDSIFNRTMASSINPEILRFYQDKNVYSSDLINKAFQSYFADDSFDNYINLINIMLDIFKEIDFLTFFKLQAANSNLSPISFKFCLDVVSEKFITNYMDYAIVPFNIRFIINNGVTEAKALENIRKIEKSCLYNQINNWETYLSRLANDRDAMITFIKYIFADYY